MKIAVTVLLSSLLGSAAWAEDTCHTLGSTTASDVSNATCAARWSPRCTGTAPIPLKKPFMNRPLSPGIVQYSSFARNATRRGQISGIRIESMNDR